MTEPLKTAARDGDIKALEALMNRSFGPKNITVRVTNSASILKICLRGSEPPARSLINPVKRGLQELCPRGFTKVFLTAEVVNQGNIWSEQWQLESTEQSNPVKPIASSSPPKIEAIQSSKIALKWYQQPWLIILLLVFVPVVGIALTWLSLWSRRNKWTATAISGAWLCFVLFLPPEQSSQPLTEAPSQTTNTTSEEIEPPSTDIEEQPPNLPDEPGGEAPEQTEEKSFEDDKTLVGESPTGYSLWLGNDDNCIYVKDLRQGDLTRLGVTLREFKQVIKEETGSRCVFFE